MNTQEKIKTPFVLSIAGSDSSGGAGIQADICVGQTLGCRIGTAITCVTAQNPSGVAGVRIMETDFIKQQIAAIAEYQKPDAIKTGMLFSPEIIELVADFCTQNPEISLVLDPVMVSRAGDILISEEAISTYTERLFPLATIITPNVPEAARLLKTTPELVRQDPEKALHALYQIGQKPVVLKNIIQQKKSADYYFDGKMSKITETPFVQNVQTHGTGCSFSSSVACFMAQGHTLSEAIIRAKQYIWNSLKNPGYIGGESTLFHQ